MIVYLYYNRLMEWLRIPSAGLLELVCFLFLKMFAAMRAHCDISPPHWKSLFTVRTFRTSISSQPYTIHCDYGRSKEHLAWYQRCNGICQTGCQCHWRQKRQEHCKHQNRWYSNITPFFLQHHFESSHFHFPIGDWMMGSLPLVVYFAHSRRLNHSHWAHPFYVFYARTFQE